MKTLAALALVLIVLHPWILLALFAVAIAALAVIGCGCWRASGIGHRRRTQRWVAWTA